jgi:hypothetical protein
MRLKPKMINITIQRLQKLPRFLINTFFILFSLNLLVIIISFSTGYNSIYGLLDQFSFNHESNIPTYFSQLNLLLAAGLLFSIYDTYTTKNTGDRKYWLILSIIFLYLSVDESATIHEIFTRPIRELLDLMSISSRWLYFPWVIVGIIFVLVFCVAFLKFYLRLHLRYKILFGLSAILLVGGSIGMEIIDGFFASGNSENALIYHLLTTLEESMEMIGTVVFIKALVDYMANRHSVIRENITQSSG